MGLTAMSIWGHCFPNGFGVKQVGCLFWLRRPTYRLQIVKPGFHSNAIACVSCGFRLRNACNARNASDCVWMETALYWFTECLYTMLHLNLIFTVNAMYAQTPVPDVYRGIFGGAQCRDSPVQVMFITSCFHFGKLRCLSDMSCALNFYDSRWQTQRLTSRTEQQATRTKHLYSRTQRALSLGP